MFEPIVLCVALATATNLPPPSIKVLTKQDLAENCSRYIEDRATEALFCPVRGRKTVGAYSASRDLVIVLDGKGLAYRVGHELVHRAQRFNGSNGLSDRDEAEASQIGADCKLDLTQN